MNGTTIATAQFTGVASANASQKYSVDLRDTFGKGIAVKPGDYITMSASAVSTAGAGTDTSCTLACIGYGVLG